MRIKAALAVGLAGAALATFGAAGTANANNLVKLYYNSNYQGNWVTFDTNIPNFAGYYFIDGQPVKNNAASAFNYGTTTATIYFNSNYAGASDRLSPGTGQSRLAHTYNENASLRFG
ncbi:peptidase inhibitor family I36 protein [Kitasatospora sp. DSM 101779]|uniref:peptidase inhibitor family I36 protein n=1 Tax=Kitasatospora sp. DSM 101779 TaxID=2853165 RepID=UPI0021DA9212|nr:peptidase inhibitor family I36 protein [Kitasatospora sp. DSM 101779]MCU7822102.1 peptidase inhibitor family I36 protein [Kitasatospora sp. DSM 101779]